MSAMRRDGSAMAMAAATMAEFVAGRFMVVPRDHWQALWRIETANRLNLVAAYLVLLAGVTSGTGLTRWSALACERYAGIGAPRARQAIAELIEGGLVSRLAVPPGEGPLYRLAERGRIGIFLPLSLVLAQDAGSLLRTLRETGDALLLRMLVDLHGLVRPDPVFGMKLEALRQGRDTPSRPVAGGRGHTVWELGRHDELVAAGAWVDIHQPAGGEGDPVHVVRPEHCQMPVLRGVARLAATPATPGLRRAMEQRLDLIRHHATVHRRLLMTGGGCDN